MAIPRSTPSDFPRKMEIILIFRRQLRFTKEEKKGLIIQEWLRPTTLFRHAAFVRNQTLYLLESLLPQVDFIHANLLAIIQDESLDCTQALGLQPNQGQLTDILRLNRTDPNELHMKWDYSTVGDPTREPMKLSNLVPEKTLEFRINGKTDFSLTGRRPRVYLEQSYFISHLGSFSSFHAIPREMAALSPLPVADKLIDLRKLLW